MAQYFVNKNAQPTGEHEVHMQGCRFMPLPQNCLPLGEHLICQSAVAAARKIFPNVDGCFHCCRVCHTK